MSGVKYTPGPWHWDDGDPLDNLMPRLVSESGEVVCDFGDCTQYYPTEGTPPDEFNARLIAAAPELLAALQQLLPHYRKAVKLYDPNTDDPFTVAARIAIAKATGGAA